jgi:alanyl aminopeptidase
MVRAMKRTLILATVLLVSCGGPRAGVSPESTTATAGPVSTAPEPAKAAAPQLRLPDTAVPQRYAVRLRLSPSDTDLRGTVDVDVRVRAATSVLWMHAAGLAVTEARVEAAGRAVVAKPRVEGEFLGLELSRSLAPGDIKVHLAFRGKVPVHDSRGVYHQEEAGADYIFTQFESTDARRAFPCFDEPSFKAPWQLTLDVPKKDLAFANTPVVSEKDGEAGRKTVVFAETKPLPSYLVAFAVGPFEVIDAGTAGLKKTPIRIITTRGRSADAAYAVKVTGEIVTRLEKYFGMPYPYEKVDHIAVPQKGGAMENPGLITFGSNLILSEPGARSVTQERRYSGVAAHELAHIWFGDLVTTAWWDDIWLNEAFATWMAGKLVDEWHPEWNERVDDVRAKNYAMAQDALNSVRKIRQPIESKHDIANAFDGITYQKGGAVIASFENWAGRAKFQKGVASYMTHHAHGNATSPEFLAEVGRETDQAADFGAAFSTFLDQPGVPLVSAELKCNGGAPRLALSQTRYRAQGWKADKPEAQRWQIPICIKYPTGAGADARVCTLMKEAEVELPLKEAKSCPAWVLPNEGQWGYYRVEYKGDLLKSLMKDGGKKLTAAERLGLLGDVNALARSGHMSEGDALAHAAALAGDKNRDLLEMTIQMIAGTTAHLVPDELRENYKRLVNKLYAARARSLGWAAKAGEDDDTQLMRPGLLGLVANEGHDAALRAEARKLSEKWFTDRKAVAPDVVGTVLAVAALDGDKAFRERLLQLAKTANRKDRGHFLNAMGALRDPELVKENFALLLSREFDAREAMTLLWGAASDRTTRQQAYDFLKQNFDAVVALLPPDSGANLAGVGGGFCDETHRADVEAFFKDRTTKFRGGPRSLAQTLEGIDQCIAFRDAQKASVAAFLKKY